MPARSLYIQVVAVASLLLASSCSGLTDAELYEHEIDLDESLIVSSAAELKTNADPNRLVVYSNNIENMIFDWKDLVHVMGEKDLRPDVFLVQQMTNQSELRQLTNFMKSRLGVDYDGVIAQANPRDQRFSGDVKPRPPVTTAVVFRSGRFEMVKKQTWMPWGTGFSTRAQRCDGRSNHSGYESLRVKLFDKLAKKHIVVVSLRNWTWEPCNSKNLAEIVDGRENGENSHPGLGDHAALHIVAGDFNEKAVGGDGEYKCWYRQALGKLGPGSCASDRDFNFTDPFYEWCKGEKSCIRKHQEVDFLLVRRSDGQRARTSHYDSISWDEGHRASVRSTGGDGPSNLRSRDGYVDVADRYSGHFARAAHVFYE